MDSRFRGNDKAGPGTSGEAVGSSGHGSTYRSPIRMVMAHRARANPPPHCGRPVLSGAAGIWRPGLRTAGGLAERLPISEFVPFVMSSAAKRSRDICLRTRRTSHSPPDPSAPLGMTRGRPPVGMTRGRPPVGMTRGRPPVGVTRGRPAFGMTRGRPPVEMTTAVTARGHENRMASRKKSEFATEYRPHPRSRRH